MSTTIACILLIVAAGPDAARNATTETLLSWNDVERQIQWHRNRVRWCGPLSAIRALRLSGHEVTTGAVLRPLSSGDPRGVPLEQVLRICRTHAVHARLVRLSQKSWQRLTLPCILVVNQGRHAVVLETISRSRQRAEIWDPSVMQVKAVPLAKLTEIWTGDAILLDGPPWLFLALASMDVAVAVVLWRRFRK